jgi:hypothetical protein
MTRRNVSAMVEVAQVPGSKLIDFCNAREVSAELFVLLARRWRVPGGLVPRLAFVFPFHHYVSARTLGDRRAREGGHGVPAVLFRAACRRLGARPQRGR